MSNFAPSETGSSEGAAARTAPRVHAVLLGVQVAFATLAVEGKIAMSRGVSPSALAMVRILGGALVFVTAHAALGTARVRSFRDMLRLAMLSIFGIVLNQALFLAGLNRTSPLSATLLVATIPVFTAVLAAVTGVERLSARGGLGVAVALSGVATLSGFAVPARGDAFVLLNALSYALYLVYAKSMLARYGTVTVIAWVFGAGALLFAPAGVPALVREVGGWSASAVGLVAFVVLVPTVVAYSLNAWALRRAPPSLVTIYVYLQPVVVAALAWVQLREALEPRMLAAGILILTGVGLVATAPRQTQLARTRS